MIQPAQATLDLTTYKLSWEGTNGYTMTGTLTAPSELTGNITQADIWDMSVSFYNPSHQLLSTRVQVEGGSVLYGDLAFSFDRSEMWVGQNFLNLGTYYSEDPSSFNLYNWWGEGMMLRWPYEGVVLDNGGTVYISLDEPAAPENTPPTLNIPTSPMIVEANQTGGAQVYFNVSASDLEDEVAPVANSNPVSGSFFGLGETIVQVSAQDSGGLSTKGSFTVLVQDTTAPAIYLGSNQCSTDLTIAVGSDFSDPGYSAYDTVNAWVGVNVTGSVDTNTVGNYTLTYTASDEKGNTSTVTRNVAVVDPMPSVNNRQYSGGNAYGQGDFKVSAKGNVTAALYIAGQTYRATFPLTGRTAEVSFRGVKGVTIPATVAVEVNGAGESVLMVSAMENTLELKPARYSSKKPAPETVAGTYTAVFRGNDWEPEIYSLTSTSEQQTPMGVGYATITVGKDGRVRVAGRTAEGTAVTASSHLVRPDCHNEPVYTLTSIEETNPESTTSTEYPEVSEFHTYTGIYKTAARGNLSGLFTLDRSNKAGSISGEFHWEAPVGALSLYPQGFEVWGPVIGSRYERSLPGELNLRFDFEGEASFIATGLVSVAPVFYDMSTTDEQRSLGLRCRFNDKTGELTGSRYRGSAARSFKAIWLQEQNTVQGFSVKGDGRSHGYVEKQEVIIEEPPVIFPPDIFPPIIPPTIPYAL